MMDSVNDSAELFYIAYPTHSLLYLALNYKNKSLLRPLARVIHGRDHDCKQLQLFHASDVVTGTFTSDLFLLSSNFL